MPAPIEAMVLEMRRGHPYWGARRIALELARKGVEQAPSESAVYRCLVHHPAGHHLRSRQLVLGHPFQVLAPLLPLFARRPALLA